MDVQIPPVFYKTSSPFGAEALLTSKATIDKSLSRQGKGIEDHLLPLGNWEAKTIASMQNLGDISI